MLQRWNTPKGHVSYHPEYLKLVYQELAQEAGVDLYTNCRPDRLYGGGKPHYRHCFSGVSPERSGSREMILSTPPAIELLSSGGGPNAPR